MGGRPWDPGSDGSDGCRAMSLTYATGLPKARGAALIPQKEDLWGSGERKENREDTLLHTVPAEPNSQYAPRPRPSPPTPPLCGGSALAGLGFSVATPMAVCGPWPSPIQLPPSHAPQVGPASRAGPASSSLVMAPPSPLWL